MATRKGKCVNFGGCSKADNREIIEVGPGEEFICPEDGKPLQPFENDSGGSPKRKTVIFASAAAVLVIGVGVWAFMPRSSYPPEPAVTGSGKPAGPIATADPNPAKAAPPAAASVANPCGLKPIDQPDLNRLLMYLKQGMTYASQNQYSLALKEFEQIQKIDPNFLAMHENIAAARLKLKDLQSAEEHLQAELKLIGCLDQTNDIELPKFAYMLEIPRGATDPVSARAHTMRERLKQARGVVHYNLACVRAKNGDNDQAIAELRQALDNGFADAAALKRDPDLASIRRDPGFKDLVAVASSKATTLK